MLFDLPEWRLNIYIKVKHGSSLLNSQFITINRSHPLNQYSESGTELRNEVYSPPLPNTKNSHRK